MNVVKETEKRSTGDALKCKHTPKSPPPFIYQINIFLI